MNLNLRIENYLELIKNNLPKKNGIKNCLTVNCMDIYEVDNVLSELSGKNFNVENTNGHDMDWSSEVIIEGKNYQVWGSGASGSLCFQLI